MAAAARALPKRTPRMRAYPRTGTQRVSYGVPLGLNGARHDMRREPPRGNGLWAGAVAAWIAFYRFMQETF